MTRMTIGIVPDPLDPLKGLITVSEGGKRKGHARAQVGRRMVWIRDPATVASFVLKFERLEEGDGAVDTSNDWPFDSVRAFPSAAKVDEVDCAVKDAEKVVVRLGNDPGIFKYTVEVVPAPAAPAAPPLDPVIIVRP
jgi:hypothetical protein